jgi:orotate phosphoribosyltransferase-like protein
MAGKGIKAGMIAQELNVDRKTIQRWLLAERKGSAEA